MNGITFYNMHVPGYTPDEPEYERTYDVADEHDRLEYAFLWGQKTKKAPRKPTQKEEIWWYSKDGCWREKTRADEPVSEFMLFCTGTKTSDWTQGYGARRRKQKDEGNTKGSRKMEMLRLRKTNKSNRKQDSYGTRWN